MEMTEETPMMIPKTVRPERTLAERRVASAARKFSRAWEEVMIAISRTSRPQSDQDWRHASPDRFQKTNRLLSSAPCPGSRPRSAPRPGMGSKCAAPAPPRHIAFLRANEEIVLHSRREMASRSQDEDSLVLRILESVGAGFYVDGQTGVHSLHTQEARERNRDEVVLVLAEHAAQLFHH